MPSAPPSGSPPFPKEQEVLKLPPRAWSLRSDARSSLLQESALEKGRGGEEGGLESQELGGAPTPPLPADQHQEPRWLYFSLGGGAADFHHAERSGCGLGPCEVKTQLHLAEGHCSLSWTRLWH